MAKGKFDWGDGRGKVHSIPLKQHKLDVRALHALGGNTDLTAPPSGVQAYREANAAANLQYGPQVQAAQQLSTNVQPWFQDYMARVAGYATAAQTQANPVLTQAQNYQTNAASQLPQGLDPSSPAYAQAQQAAQGRQSLAQLGLDALNSQNQATQGFFTGQQAIAAREQPAVQRQAATALANAKSQRGQAVTSFLTTARQNAQNYAIARGTLGLNTAKAQADATNTAAAIQDRAQARKDAARNKDNTVITSGAFAGMTYGQVRSMSPQDKQTLRNAAKKPEQVITSGPFAGYTQSQISRHSPKWVQRRIAASKGATGGSDSSAFETKFYRQYGVKPATTAQRNSARNKLQQAESFVRELKGGGNNRDTVHGLLLQGGKVQIGTQNGKPQYKTYPKQDATMLAVALDLAYNNGHISGNTQNILHHAGLLAQWFGLPTKAPSLPKPPKKPKPLTNNPLTGASNPLMP